MVTIECVISKAHHRTVMGAKGYKVQGITQEFDVQIKFPDREIESKFYDNSRKIIRSFWLSN